MFKYNNVVCAEALLVFPDMLLIFVCAMIGILSAIMQTNLFLQIPPIVYWICGGIAVLMNLSYLIYYLCSKKICRVDAERLVLMDGKKTVELKRENIELILYHRSPYLIFTTDFDGYGLTEIYCTDALQNSRHNIHVFPHVIRRLKKLGYPTEKF